MRRLLLALPVLLAVALAGVFLLRSTNHAPVDSKDITTLETPEGGAARAMEIRKVRVHNETDFKAHVSEALRRDPTYGAGLLKVDKKSVQSLERLSDPEKEELWKLIQSAQSQARQEGRPVK